MELTLFNTRTRRPEPFAPASPDRVTMYLCGPTVYNYVHIGNARGPVVFDVLASLLRRRYPRLVYARNITDVDDKINKAAQDLGVPITTITDKYTAVYRDDMARLGVARQDAGAPRPPLCGGAVRRHARYGAAVSGCRDGRQHLAW